MRKLNLAEGILVLLGLLLIANGVIAKVAGFNVVEQLIVMPHSFFIAANSCFLLALVLNRFGK